MPTFEVTAKVDQIVTKEVGIIVEAREEEDAESKAREALQTYPDEVRDVEGIRRMVTRRSNHWIPRDIEITTIERIKDG